MSINVASFVLHLGALHPISIAPKCISRLMFELRVPQHHCEFWYRFAGPTTSAHRKPSALADVNDYRHPPGNKRSGQDKHMKTRRIAVVIGACLALFAAPGAASAQESFPNRPVRIVVPYSPGSVTDVFARIIAQNMAAQWGGSIVVEFEIRRQRFDRRRGSRALGAGRLHVAAGDDLLQRQPGAGYETALGPGARLSSRSGRCAGRRISSSFRSACR